ncbi:hypothetical protein MRX96_029537 [Rhipicephalus microplus]
MTVDFRDYFWGEKNNGFDVLYHNMKYGYLAAKDLAEFFRERSLVEESHSKLLSKLARQAAGSCSTGTFGPLWGDLVREVQRYCEEQHRRHKQVKEEEAPTLEVVQGLQQTTGALAKAREAYAARCLELEKLKRESSPKDLDKAEAKARKACEEYRQLVERHGVVRADFERRMAGSCQRFQELEVHAEFRQQCDALDIDTLLRQFADARQTGSEKPEVITFEEPDPSLQLTPTNAATTGSPPFFTTSTPAPSASGAENGPVLPADFCPTSAAAAAQSSAATNGPQAPAAKKEGFLRTKWERQKEKRKRKKEMSSKDASTTSGEAARVALGRAGGSGTLHEPSPPCERSTLRRLSVEQPRATSDLDSLFHVPVCTATTATTSVVPVPTRDSKESEEQNAEVDEEGYTVRPSSERHKENDRDSFYSSSDGDSDDEDRDRRIHIEIKPLSNGAPMSASVDELRATIGSLSLSPIPQHSARRAYNSASSTPDEAPKRPANQSSKDSGGVGSGTEADMLGLFPLDASASTPTTRLQSPLGQGEPASQPSASSSVPSWDRYAALSDLFQRQGTGRVVKRSEAVRGRASPLPMSRTESVGKPEQRLQDNTYATWFVAGSLAAHHWLERLHTAGCRVPGSGARSLPRN